MPYVSTYNPLNPKAFTIIRNNLPILMKDYRNVKIFKNTRFIKSKRQPPNLKNLITNARFSEVLSEFKVTKCHRPNCKHCDHITESKSYDFKGKIFHVKTNMSCDVKTSYTSSHAMGAVNIISDKLGTNCEQGEILMRNKSETPQ